MRASLLFCFALLPLFLAACDDSPSAPRDDDDDDELLIPTQANPANAAVSFESVNAVTDTVLLTGGVLVATGSDGTVYTLTIPDSALVDTAAITMTPIASISGAGITGERVVGVRLEPEGLELFRPAALLIAPPEGTHVEAVGLSFYGLGSEIHRVPVVLDPTKLELPVFNFRGWAILLGAAELSSVPLENVVPTEVADRMATSVEPELRAMRNAMMLGAAQARSIAPNEDSLRLVTKLRQLWEHEVAPLLTLTHTECAFYVYRRHIAQSWWRQLQFYHGIEELFPDETARISPAIIDGLRKCFWEAVGDCINDPWQREMVRQYARELALLGVEDPAINSEDPALYCPGDWSGYAIATAPFLSGEQRLETTVTFEMLPDSSFYNYEVYGVKEGTVKWTLEGSSDDCTWRGSQTFTIGRGHGQLRLDFNDATPTYTVQHAMTLIDGSVPITVTCPTQTMTIEWNPGDWLYIDLETTTEDPRELAGTRFSDPWTYAWNFAR